MSILDIFRSTPATTPAPTESTPKPAPAAHTESTPNPDATPDTTSATPATPLEDFSKLWETAPTDPNAPSAGVFGELDPKKIFEAAKGANFAATVPQETLQAIAAGGEGAIKAMQEALNHTTQAVFAQSTLATTKLVEQAIKKTMDEYESKLPGLVARHAASDSLRNKNPALSNPAAAPIIAAVQAQLAIKHPNATASQLTEMAESYLSNFAEVVKPTKEAPKDETKPGEVDWSKFLS